jgi:hypothetical protein
MVATGAYFTSLVVYLEVTEFAVSFLAADIAAIATFYKRNHATNATNTVNVGVTTTATATPVFCKCCPGNQPTKVSR